MKENKGFTLIELLAVIIILAIIALIATPIIIGVIDDARKGAFENTSYGVLEGLKLSYVERTMNGTTSEEKTYIFPNDELKLSGEQPTYGQAKIDGNGNISFRLIDKDKKWCAKKEATSEQVKIIDYEKETCEIKEISDGTIVYFDPVSGTKCDTYVEENSFNANKSGCMKWYTFGGNNNGDYVNLIVDHNIAYKVAWNTNNINTDSSQINETLSTLTNEWKESLKPRLITANELAQISGNNNFDSNDPLSSDPFYLETNSREIPNLNGNPSKYAWLFNYTKNCSGCTVSDNSSDYGFWTSSSKIPGTTNVWILNNQGYVSNNYAKNNIYNGIRPVITILKSDIL